MHVFGGLGALRPIDQFAIRLSISVHHEETALAATKDPVNFHLAVLDSDNGAGAGVHDIVLRAGAVRKDNNDLFAVFIVDQWLQARQPVHQAFHVWFLRLAAEELFVLVRWPGHGHDH